MVNEQITTVILGLGSRGNDTYGTFISNNQSKIKIVAIADIDDKKLERCKKRFGIPEEKCFKNDKELFAREKLADTILICTQDKDHVEHAIKALEKGYDILLEKPISPDAEECKMLAKMAKKHKRHIIVCHVLRYTPFYKTIKKLIDDGVVGDIVTTQAIENVGYFHQAHSFVRGNWRREEETSPMILAKCCHDMDILLWLTGKKCKRVSSFGNLYLFKKEKAPKGAPKRCIEGCPAYDTCEYNAVKYYLEDARVGAKSGYTGWPLNVLCINPTVENVTKALETGPYGRCVYHCDNDVVDHQVVNLDMEDGSTISFTMSAFTDICNRQIKIMGTKGCIEADTSTNLVYYTAFGKEKQCIDITKTADNLSGHGGGDDAMMEMFIKLINSEDGIEPDTTIEKSVESHIIALKAEKSRINNGMTIEINE